MLESLGFVCVNLKKQYNINSFVCFFGVWGGIFILSIIISLLIYYRMYICTCCYRNNEISTTNEDESMNEERNNQNLNNV